MSGVFSSSLYIENSDIKNLKVLLLINGHSFYRFEKRKKRGHHTNYLKGGPNLARPSQILNIIQYKVIRSLIDCHFLFYISSVK